MIPVHTHHTMAIGRKKTDVKEVRRWQKQWSGRGEHIPVSTE